MTDDTSLVVETRGLTKRFGDRLAIDDVDLAIPRASAFGFLGPNGAGKTTMIRTLLGLTRATAGEMRLPPLARVGAIVEEPRFHGHLTGRENLWIAAAARDQAAERRIPEALARVGLSARADERVSGYSMGMRQRLGVARCLIADPELLILDEPTNGLDPAGVLEFRDLVRGLVDEGRTVFLSSHLLDEVERICDHVAIVDRGRVAWQGAIGDLATSGGTLIEVGCDSPGRAALLLDSVDEVAALALTEDGVRVTIAPGGQPRAVAARVARRIVEGGLALDRLQVTHATLEERFLEITTRFEEAA